MPSTFRVLIAQHRWWFPTAVNGADLANQEFACKMVERGMDVAVHGIMPPGESRRVASQRYKAGNIPVRLVRSDFLHHLRKKIEQYKPHVIFTTCPEPNCGPDDITRMIDVVSSFDLPVVLYVHDLESTLPLFRDIRNQLAAIVTNSKFMAKRIEEHWSIPSHVVYPIPEWRPLDTAIRNGPFITFFNPLPHKGLGIAHTLVVRRFPDHPFLFVEGFIDPQQHGIALTRSGNLVHARRSPDVATIYSMSKLVIIPSQWEEPFGRVALESMLSDVPVIASRTGGLPESVGDGGILIDDFTNTDQWANAIERLGDPKERQRIIACGKRHVKDFSINEQTDKLIDILKKSANYG